LVAQRARPSDKFGGLSNANPLEPSRPNLRSARHATTTEVCPDCFEQGTIFPRPKIARHAASPIAWHAIILTTKVCPHSAADKGQDRAAFPPSSSMAGSVTVPPTYTDPVMGIFQSRPCGKMQVI